MSLLVCLDHIYLWPGAFNQHTISQGWEAGSCSKAVEGAIRNQPDRTLVEAQNFKSIGVRGYDAPTPIGQSKFQLRSPDEIAFFNRCRRYWWLGLDRWCR